MCNLNRAKKHGKKLDIYALDRKLNHLLNYHRIKPVKVYGDFDEVPTESQIDEITQEVINKYMSGQIDGFGIVYTRFYSVSSQQAQTLTILPLTELIDDL